MVDHRKKRRVTEIEKKNQFQTNTKINQQKCQLIKIIQKCVV